MDQIALSSLVVVAGLFAAVPLLRRPRNLPDDPGEQRDQMPKYMMMMNGTESGWKSFNTFAPEDIKAHIDFMKSKVKKLQAQGELIDAQGLDMPERAKIVRADNKKGGRPVIMDGPFAETKEFLVGYWMIEVASLERAIEIAAELSAAPGKGGETMSIPIEIRQVMAAPE
jgi:hypothetical protein